MGVELRVVVYPPNRSGGRQVRLDGVMAGVVHGMQELLDFLDRHGLDPEELVLDNPAVIEWRGGGPGEWTAQP